MTGSVVDADVGTSKEKASHAASVKEEDPPPEPERQKMQDRMSHAERERRYKRFYGEEESPMQAILESPWVEKVWGPRLEGYGLGMLHQARENIRRKKKEEASRRKDKDHPPEPEREKIYTEEEQVISPPPETIQGEEEQLNSPPPEPMELEHGDSQPSPPSERATDRVIPCSWVPYITMESDNPATWICDEYGEWRPRSAINLPPYYRDPDPEALQYFDDMAEYYLEAARRLPIAQMPKLAGFLPLGGLLLGLNDPVTNIIVNAIYLMGNFRYSDVLPDGVDPVRHAVDRASYVRIARKSRAALVVFMTFYFRHLTEAQAKRYLGAARHDLALAIGLVEWHRRGGFGTPSELLAELSPECSRAKTAFRYAVQAANRVAGPDDVLLLASRFPCHLLDPVLDDLRCGEQLSMYLIDTIHGMYIQALAMLPSDQQARLLRAMLAGGHCYGVMDDPVFNIVINSIWYNAHFPHHETDDDTMIKAIRSIIRAESSSLHGLIAILLTDHGVTEQEAVACLCKNSHLMKTSSLKQHSLAAAAEAAEHPQPAALVAFFTTLLTPEKRDRLRSLLTAKRTLSYVDFKELNTMIAGNGTAAEPVQSVTFPATYQPSIFNTMHTTPVQKMSPDRRLQSYLCTKVEKLLIDHGRSNQGPQYKLGVICGVASMMCSSYNIGTTCYHVNFLASTPADSATTSAPGCKLFFAEFWNQADEDFERSTKPPVCCSIQDYHAFPGKLASH
ncbi:unnamed protein product [Alopecurus aequalis]